MDKRPEVQSDLAAAEMMVRECIVAGNPPLTQANLTNRFLRLADGQIRDFFVAALINRVAVAERCGGRL